MLEYHPLAEIFPLIAGSKFDALVASVRKNGLVDPIILYEGRILDGRNRHLACVAAGVEPRFESYVGEDLVGFVRAKNMMRRNLTPSQRANATAKPMHYFEAEAKARKWSGRRARTLWQRCHKVERPASKPPRWLARSPARFRTHTLFATAARTKSPRSPAHRGE